MASKLRAVLIDHCRRRTHATEDIKWVKDLVFSVGGKMFACFDTEGGSSISFKTTPENFAHLTRQPGFVPAPYAARFHWVLVQDADALPIDAVRELVNESYRLVAEKLPQRVQRELGLSEATGSRPAKPKTAAHPRTARKRPSQKKAGARAAQRVRTPKPTPRRR